MGSVTASKAVTENAMLNMGKTFPRGFLENPCVKFDKGGLELSALARAFKQAQNLQWEILHSREFPIWTYWRFWPGRFPALITTQRRVRRIWRLHRQNRLEKVFVGSATFVDGRPTGEGQNWLSAKTSPFCAISAKRRRAAKIAIFATPFEFLTK